MKSVLRCIFSAVAASAALFSAVADGGETWSSRPPLQDTYIGSSDAEKGVPKGNAEGLIVGNGREAFMMFDVSGLAGVTAARVKLYVTQCGTTADVKWPVYFRVMRDDTWNESDMTWNTRPSELSLWPSPVLAKDDPSLAGYVEIPAGAQGTWVEVDVTEAVKAAAPRGRLALHIYTYEDKLSGDTTPLVFATSDYVDDATLRPALEFTGAEDSAAATLTLLPTADTFIQKNKRDEFGESEHVIVEEGGREGFLRFDLSGLDEASVESAVLQVRMNQTQTEHSAGSTVQFQLMKETAWSEKGVTWANAPSKVGITPGGWESETPPDAVRCDSAATNRLYTIELAPLVNQVLAAGGKTMSLHVSMKKSASRFFIFYSRDYSNAAWRPRLLVTPSKTAAAVSRKPLQETFVSDYNEGNKSKSFYSGSYASYVQIGCEGNKVQYGMMLFDVSGLEDAPYVRLRVANKKEVPAGDGVLRVSAWTTDGWNETNMTWNSTGPWFPQPATVTAENPPDGLVADIDLTQKKSAGTYFEVDVTDAARAAAQAGRKLTLGLFSNYNWPEFYKGAASATPAALVFPDPDATFGARVTASLDESGSAPALRLAWSPSATEGAVYKVERQRGGTWKTVAAGLREPTCLDANAEPNTDHTYRITETATGASVTKTVSLNPAKTLAAEADTYIYGGGKTASHGKETMLVVKYQGADNGKREVFARFDLSGLAHAVETARLKVVFSTDSASETGDEKLTLAKYPDFEWSDEDAPVWNAIYGGTQADETELATWKATAGAPLSKGDAVEFDVSQAVKAALAAREKHITFHLYAYDPQGNWNFGLASRELPAEAGPRLECTLKNWVKRGLVIIIK